MGPEPHGPYRGETPVKGLASGSSQVVGRVTGGRQSLTAAALAMGGRNVRDTCSDRTDLLAAGGPALQGVAVRPRCRIGRGCGLVG